MIFNTEGHSKAFNTMIFIVNLHIFQNLYLPLLLLLFWWSGQSGLCFTKCVLENVALDGFINLTWREAKSWMSSTSLF